MLPKILTRQTVALLTILIACTLTSLNAYAQAQDASDPAGARVIETGILQNVPGFTGDVLGAEVIAITTVENDIQVIDIVIPVNPDDVDQVRVLTPDGKPLKQRRAMEILMDHENNEIGVVLRLSKTDKLGFKFRLIDLPQDQ
jgi:hypothetical protein